MIELDCVCANARRASRLVTQLYSREMGEVMEPSQFLLLSVLAKKPGWPQVLLGEALGYDKTTLSRSLRLMRSNGWIAPSKAEDQRERGYRLTPQGKAILAVIMPHWQTAQKKMRAAMSASEWDIVTKAFGIVSRVAAELS